MRVPSEQSDVGSRLQFFCATLRRRLGKRFLIGIAVRLPFALAGLREGRKNPEAREVVQTFTILITTPNELCGAIHDRMAMIVGREEWRIWLGEGEATADQLLRVLRLFPTALMRA